MPDWVGKERGLSEQTPPEGFEEATSASGFSQLIGPFYNRKEADGSITRGFFVEDKHLNLAGISHGGMMMSFADTLLASAIRAAGGGPSVTIRMTTDFVGPSRQGDWVEGSARVVRQTKTLYFVEGEVRNRKHVILTASAIFRKIVRRNG